MGHHIIGLISKPQILEAFARKHNLHQPIELVQEQALLPLRESDLERIAPEASRRSGNFEHWSEPLSEELARASKGGAIVYFATVYFGGLGGQEAAAYVNGSLKLGPEFGSIGPISRALRLLGVKVLPPARDEFDVLGLGAYRDVEGWLSKPR